MLICQPGRMRFLALSLGDAQADTHTHTMKPTLTLHTRPNGDLFRASVMEFPVQTVLEIRHALFSLRMNLRLFSAPFLDPLALSVVAFMRNCFFASQRVLFIVCDSLLYVCVCVVGVSAFTTTTAYMLWGGIGWNWVCCNLIHSWAVTPFSPFPKAKLH